MHTISGLQTQIKRKARLQIRLDGGEMNALLLKKVEELTLHVIQQQKDIEKLNCDIEYLKNQNK